MSRHSKKRLLWTGFVLAMFGMLPTAPRPAMAGLAALDAFHVGRYHLANGQREQALHARFLRSPHAHARILSIDTSRAEALPGVFAVVTGKDFPEVSAVLREQTEG